MEIQKVELLRLDTDKVKAWLEDFNVVWCEPYNADSFTVMMFVDFDFDCNPKEHYEISYRKWNRYTQQMEDCTDFYDTLEEVLSELGNYEGFIHVAYMERFEFIKTRWERRCVEHKENQKVVRK